MTARRALVTENALPGGLLHTLAVLDPGSANFSSPLAYVFIAVELTPPILMTSVVPPGVALSIKCFSIFHPCPGDHCM